jgi:hypothetical protein
MYQETSSSSEQLTAGESRVERNKRYKTYMEQVGERGDKGINISVEPCATVADFQRMQKMAQIIKGLYVGGGTLPFNKADKEGMQPMVGEFREAAGKKVRTFDAGAAGYGTEATVLMRYTHPTNSKEHVDIPCFVFFKTPDSQGTAKQVQASFDDVMKDDQGRKVLIPVLATNLHPATVLAEEGVLPQADIIAPMINPNKDLTKESPLTGFVTVKR